VSNISLHSIIPYGHNFTTDEMTQRLVGCFWLRADERSSGKWKQTFNQSISLWFPKKWWEGERV